MGWEEPLNAFFPCDNYDITEIASTMRTRYDNTLTFAPQ